MSPTDREFEARRYRLAAVRSLRRRPAVSHHRLVIGLAGCAAGALLTGCGGSGVNPQTGPTQTRNTSDPAPSTSGTPNSASQRAEDAALRQVRSYERTVDDLAIHPRLSLDRLYSV